MEIFETPDPPLHEFIQKPDLVSPNIEITPISFTTARSVFSKNTSFNTTPDSTKTSNLLEILHQIHELLPGSISPSTLLLAHMNSYLPLYSHPVPSFLSDASTPSDYQPAIDSPISTASNHFPRNTTADHANSLNLCYSKEISTWLTQSSITSLLARANILNEKIGTPTTPIFATLNYLHDLLYTLANITLVSTNINTRISWYNSLIKNYALREYSFLASEEDEEIEKDDASLDETWNIKSAFHKYTLYQAYFPILPKLLARLKAIKNMSTSVPHVIDIKESCIHQNNVLDRCSGDLVAKNIEFEGRLKRLGERIRNIVDLL